MLLLDRSHSFITRWHARPDMGQRESVAEHMGWVVRLSMLIASFLSDKEIDYRVLYEMALIHDDPEILTGDIPGSFKRLVPTSERIIRQWEEDVIPLIYKDYPVQLRVRLIELMYRFNEGQCLESKIVKLADTCAALAYAHMQVQMGNSLFEDIEREIWSGACGQIARLPVDTGISHKLVNELDINKKEERYN